MEINDKISRDEQALIHSIVNAEVIFQRHQAAARSHPPLVALSRDYGSGGAAVARLLADRLGVELYDRQILEQVAQESHVAPQQMSHLDDKAGVDKITSWIRGLFSSSTAYPESYRYHLVNVILGICPNGGVIMGRGAHVILSTRPAFRIRLVGSVENCAERIAEREGITLYAARDKVRSVNTERDEYLWNMFRRRLSDASLFDMVVNTDKFSDTEKLVDLVLLAMAQSGHTVVPRGEGG